MSLPFATYMAMDLSFERTLGPYSFDSESDFLVLNVCVNGVRLVVSVDVKEETREKKFAHYRPCGKLTHPAEDLAANQLVLLERPGL
jgi:hypothetical protein